MMPENEKSLNREHGRRDFHRILSQQADIGAAKIIADHLFEPSNTFDPNSRRKLKPEILIVLSYFLLMAAVFAAFNSR